MNEDSASRIEIRRARVDEWRTIRRLRLRALREDPLAFGSTYAREEAFDDSVWIERTEHGARSAESSQWVALDSRGNLLGLATVAEVDGNDHLFGMWVAPESRRRGIGTRLLDRATDWSRSTHPGRPLILEVNPQQAAAVALYESRGFQYTGVERPLGHTEGQVVREMVLRERTGP